MVYLYEIYGGTEMAAQGRLDVILRCSECKSENYNATRNKKLHAEKMEVLKFCPKCNKKTVHKEKK